MLVLEHINMQRSVHAKKTSLSIDNQWRVGFSESEQTMEYIEKSNPQLELTDFIWVKLWT